MGGFKPKYYLNAHSRLTFHVTAKQKQVAKIISQAQKVKHDQIEVFSHDQHNMTD